MRVVGGALPEQTQALKAVNAYNTVVCDEFDLDAVKQFTTAWFNDPRSKAAESAEQADHSQVQLPHAHTSNHRPEPRTPGSQHVRRVVARHGPWCGCWG
ncbi:hypothetical protein GCM10010429_58510 [Micromonospora olivasterospora]